MVRGESSGNTHAIYAVDGPAYCDNDLADELRVATVTVPNGSVAYLCHPEYGFMGIGPGNYEIRRQREWARGIRPVAD